MKKFIYIFIALGVIGSFLPDEETNSISNSINEISDNSNGTYLYSESYGETSITVIGNRYFGRSMRYSGFGRENDERNAERLSGEIVDGRIYDSSGTIVIGRIKNNYLTYGNITLTKE